MKKYKLIYFIIFFVIISENNYSQGWFNQNSGTVQDLHSVFFVNKDTGWIVGYWGTFQKTTNGGNNWTSGSKFTSHHLSSIFFLNEQLGWATTWYSEGEIFKTSDGGHTWNQQIIKTYPGFTSVQFINSDTGYATYGQVEDAKIYKSIDGGLNWNPVFVYSQYYVFRDVCFIDKNNGWVVGHGGKILNSTDGGSNWNIQESGTSDDLWAVYFINEETGWCVGTNGRILKTTDAGKVWISQQSPSSALLRDVRFINENTGWIVGDYMILKTTTGGEIWESYLGGGTVYMSIFFIDNSTGWIVGRRGKILKTIDGGIPVEMINFTSNILDNGIELKWSTATETNNKGFEIERKTEISDWQTIGFKEGNGTTTESQHYSFVDNLFGVSATKLSYRLKQIDYDGTFTYSNVIEIELSPTKFSLSQNYPNPFNPTTKIKYTIPTTPASLPLLGKEGIEGWLVTLKVYDILGNEVATLVNEYKSPGTYEVEFNSVGARHASSNTNVLPSGVYFYQLKAGDFIETKKMILLR